MTLLPIVLSAAALSSAASLHRRTIDPTQPFHLNATYNQPPYQPENVLLCPIETADGWIVGDYCFPDRQAFTWTITDGALSGVYNRTLYTSVHLDPATAPANGTYVTLEVESISPTGDVGVNQTNDTLTVTDAPAGRGEDWWICPPLGGAEYGRVLTYGFTPGAGTDLQNSNCQRYNLTVSQA